MKREKNKENAMKKIYSTIFTVPNLLTFYRLLLAPLLYLSLLEGMRDVCLLIFVLSGVSDLADGFFARRLGQISDLGKMIDPVADKLTYFFILLGLCQTTPSLSILLIALIVKESICSITSLLSIRISAHVNGARWHGKLCSTVLYLTVLLQLTPLHSIAPLRLLTLALSILCMAISCVFYVIEHVRVIQRSSRTITDLIKK